MTTSYEVSSQQSERNQSLVSRNDRIEGIIATIYDNDTQEISYKGFKQEGIARLAFELEQMMIQSGQQQEINQICSIICRRFIDDERQWLARDAMEILDNKYKRKSHHQQHNDNNNNKQEDSSMQSPPGGVDLPVECSIMAKDVLKWLMNFSDNFDPEEVDDRTNQKILDLTYDIIDKEEQYCEVNHIAYHNIHEPKTPFDEANETADRNYSAKISKPWAPMPLDQAIRETDMEAFEKTKALCNYILKWADKQLRKYPSQRLDQAIRWRDATEAFIKIVKQLLDDKARRTIKQWAEINANMSRHGGTAASSMSAQPVFVPGTSCQQMIDPKTKEPVYRTITKEQIDARGPQYASDIDFMIRQLVYTQMMEERYVQIECGFGEWRAVSANPKLSRSA